MTVEKLADDWSKDWASHAAGANLKSVHSFEPWPVWKQKRATLPYLEDGKPVDGSVVIGSPPFISTMYCGHLEGVPQPDP